MRRLFGFKKGPTEEKAAGEGVSGSESPEPSSKGVVQRHLNYYEDLGAATVGESQERRQGSSNSGRKQGEVQRQVAFLNPPVSADVSSPILKPAHSTESNHGNSTACCKTSSNTGAAHIEPSLTSPPLNKSRDSPSQNSSRVPSAPFPSYGPASGANARSWTPANQAIPDSMHRAISPLSTSTVTSRPYFSRNLHPLDRSLVSRNSSSTTQLNPPTTWSELADPDLVDNLGGRERTRQEVLYEIVASEERYVTELRLLVECYVQPLLFPGGIPTNTSSEAPTLQARFPPVDSSRSPDLDSQFHSQNSRHHLQASSRTSMRRNSSQSMTESSDNLPIAARFARTLNASQDSGMPALSSSSREPQSHRRNSYSSAQSNTLVNAAHVPSMDEHEVDASGEHGHQQRMKRKSELAHSRPPTSQSRYQNMPSSSKGLPSLSKDQNTSQSSLGKTPNIIRHHLKSLGPPSHNKLHRSDKNIPLSERTAPNIPEPLRVVLNTISDHLAGRHDTLCGLLQERLRLQWPLVRSLSDIWVDQSWLVHDYGTYVLHLEKALQAVEDAMASIHPKAKSKSSEQDKENRKLAKYIIKLEERASARGESGLAICLSKPFQRLLKYPLLFQNLLYHTDAATAEYEGTQQLALEIDRIVKSIESEKVSEEERDRIRDLWARIEGVNDKALMVPLKERFLLDESPAWGPSVQTRSVSDVSKPDNAKSKGAAQSTEQSSVKGKKTVRRFSDFVHSSDKDKKPPSTGSKKDVWIIRLSDVVLKCQRTGVTSRPLGAILKKDSKGKKYTGPKRNLYRFIGVDRWEPQLAFQSSLEDGASEATVVDDDVTTESGASRMSFSYADDEPRPVLAPLAPGSRAFHGYQEADEVGELKPPPQSGSNKFGNRMRGADRSATPALRSPTPTAPGRRRAYEAPTTAYLSKVRPVGPAPRGSEGDSTPVRTTEATSTGSLSHSSSAAALYATYTGMFDSTTSP